ncbi:MAG: ABC transporter permease subunit [bacterium]|nr:ABC transporter permease subunit [bacterium]
MSPTRLLRILFWVGWAVWFFVSGLLVLAMTPLGDWQFEEGILHLTWQFLLFWTVLFWAYTFVFRFRRSTAAIMRIGKAIIGLPQRVVKTAKANPLFFITWAVLLVGWQLMSYIAPKGTLEHPLVPGFDYIIYNALYRLSGNWDLFGGFTVAGLPLQFGALAPFPAIDGPESRTWTAVFLALGFHSVMTLSRLITGLGVGLIAGLATGLALPYWSALRQISWAPFNFLRMIPLLAAIPWMQFALGVDLRATTLFIGFGVWVMLVVATMNAVANVPDRYIESARTLGASRLRTYLKVIVPGAMPELRTALLLAGGLGWSLTIAAEFLGFPTGLGFMAASAVQETNTARLVIVAIVVAFYSLLTFYLLNQMFNRMVSWMPQRTSGETDISKVAGAAGAASRAEAQLHE